MLYVLKYQKAISRLLLLITVALFFPIGSITTSSNANSYINEKIEKKYKKWEIAIKNPKNSANVFSFFYNNPHWPLFHKSVKIAEKNITKEVPDSMVLKWFKRYPPMTSAGILAYIKRLLVSDPEFAKTYIVQTWIFQNLSPKFLRKYRRTFEAYITPIDDAKKAKRLISKLDVNKLLALKDVVIKEISSHIVTFLSKYLTSKSSGYSPYDLADIDKKHAIVQRLINAGNNEKAANILLLSNKNEEKYANSFFNQRRHVAFEVLRSGNSKLAYDVMKMYKLNVGDRADERIARAEWLLGYISFRFFKNLDDAIGHFRKAYNNSKVPIRLSKNAFWQAEVHQMKGDYILALQCYRKAEKYFSTFYGYLAKERLRTMAQGKFSVIDDFYGSNETIIPVESEIIFYNRELVQVLLSIEDKKMSKLFYQQLVYEIEDPNEELLLMNLASTSDEDSILIAENSIRQHYFSNKKAYKVLTAADMRCVSRINTDPCFASLVHSVIHRESRFNQNAKSNAGAVGLMQILPSTAKFESKRMKIYTGGNSLYNRSVNITVGSSILNRLLKKYNNDFLKAAAAYNCGEGGLSSYVKRIRKLKDLTALDFIELMPIKQTRIYIKHVARALFAYQKRFAVVNCYDCDKLLTSVGINKPE